MAAPKILQRVLGRVKELATINASAGAGDADKIPATNASGVLAPSLLNAATTGNDKVVMTDGTGKLDSSIMPTGIGPDTKSILTSEALAAGDTVNVYNNAGTLNVRKADATAVGKEGCGFVLAGFGSGVNATVYFEGRNTQRSGMTPGARQYVSKTTPGATTEDVSAFGAANVVQCVGIALTATEMDFERGEPIELV